MIPNQTTVLLENDKNRYVDLEKFDKKSIKKYKIKKNKIIVYLVNGKKYSIINTKENENKINRIMIDFQKKYYDEILSKEQINFIINKDHLSRDICGFCLGILAFGFSLSCINDKYVLYPEIASLTFIGYETCNVIKDFIKLSIIKSKIKNLEKMKLYYDNEELIKENVNEDILENVNNKEINKDLDITQVRKMRIEELQKLIDSIKFYQQYDFETYDDLNKTYSEKEIEELSNKYNEEEKNKVRTLN